MGLNVSCPQCKAPIKATDELIGKKVRCKGCGHIFVISAGPTEKPKPVKATPTKPAPAKVKADEEEGSPNPYGFADEEEAAPRCPHCAQELDSHDSVICIHCGYNTVTRQRVQSKKVVETTGGDTFMWLLPGLGAVFFILVLIGIDICYCLLSPGWAQGGDYEWLTAGGFRLWFFIMTLFGMFFAGKFAFSRLILNPTPPEKLKN
jgi:predicted Zn finger-like uncharacterized protein